MGHATLPISDWRSIANTWMPKPPVFVVYRWTFSSHQPWLWWKWLHYTAGEQWLLVASHYDAIDGDVWQIQLDWRCNPDWYKRSDFRMYRQMPWWMLLYLAGLWWFVKVEKL